MKKVNAVIDGHFVIVNVPESLHEFKEGARLLSTFLDNEGILFDFNKNERLTFENSGVSEDLTLLFFDSFVNQSSVVTEVKQLNANSISSVTSQDIHSIALELKKSFCEEQNIGKGSILTLDGIEGLETKDIK